MATLTPVNLLIFLRIHQPYLISYCLSCLYCLPITLSNTIKFDQDRACDPINEWLLDEWRWILIITWMHSRQATWLSSLWGVLSRATQILLRSIPPGLVTGNTQPCQTKWTYTHTCTLKKVESQDGARARKHAWTGRRDRTVKWLGRLS